MLAAPEDVALRLVFADALAQAGDPRGELIHLQVALAAATSERDRLRAAIAKRIVGLEPAHPHLALDWRLGFIEAATITGDGVALVERVLAHPAGRLVRALCVAVDDPDRERLAEIVAARPRPSLLRRIEVGRATAAPWVTRVEPAWVESVAKTLVNLDVRAFDRISPAEFDATVGAETGEGLNELWMEQIAPLIEMWPYHAELVIREGCREQVEDIHDALSDRVQYLLRLDDDRLTVYQSSDRTYAGYGNLYQAVRALTPFIEDVRFVIGEWGDADWFDEYTIDDGVLRVTRRTLAGDYWLKRVTDEPDDRALRDHAIRLRLRAADRLLQQLDRETGTRRANTITALRDTLDIAAGLDETQPDLWRHRGRLTRATGDFAASDRAFARIAELAQLPGIAFDRALVAITARDDASATSFANTFAVEDPAHTGGRLIAAFLAGTDERAEPHLRALLATIAERRRTITNLGEAQSGVVWTAIEPAEEDLLRTGRHAEILTWCAEAFARLVRRDAMLREPAAAYLLGWADISRIHVAHNRNKRDAAKLARVLFKAAAAIDSLAGSVHYYWSLFDKRRAIKLLELGLAAGPDHLCTLGSLGAAARKAGDYDRAVTLLERYVTVFRAAHTGGVWGMFWDFHLAELAIAHYEKACVLLYGVKPGVNRPPGKPSPEALDRADAALDSALAMHATLSHDQQRAGAGVFQVKAMIAEYRDDHERALEWVDRALAANAQSPHAWSTKGGCLNNLGRLDEAITCCEKALAIDAKHWYAHYVIACVFTKRDGDRADIYRRLQLVLEEWPEGRSELATDPDLAMLRDEPAFRVMF